MNREEKAQQIEHLRQVFQGSSSGVLTGFNGITVEEVNRLRGDLRKEGVSYQVIKNTLAKKAIEGTNLAKLSSMLEGPTALAYTSADPTGPARVLRAFVKDVTKLKDASKLTLKGGFLGESTFGAKDVDRIASMPSKNELRSMLLGVFMGVPRGVVTLFNDVPAGFVRVLEARRTELDKAPSAGDEAAPAV